MLAIITTVFYFQSNNKKIFLTFTINYYLTEVKYHQDAINRYYNYNSLHFNILLTFLVGSIKLKFYDTFWAKCSPKISFCKYFVLVFSYESLGITHQCFLMINDRKKLTCNKYIAPISFLIFDIKSKPIRLVLLIVSESNLRSCSFIILFTKNHKNTAPIDLYFIIIIVL